MKQNILKNSIAAMALLAAVGVSAQTAPSFSSIELPCSNRMFQGNHLWMDYNNDGKMDLVVKGRDLNNDWNIKAMLLVNNGETFELNDLAGKIELNESYHKVFATIDYNNDGYADLLYVGNGVAKLYKNTKGNSFKEVTTFQMADMNNEEEVLYAGTISIADFDGDGFQDIATFDADRNVILYRNNAGDGTFNKVEDALAEGTLAKLGSGSLAWGDYDNDGRPDLLVSGWGESSTYAVIYHNLGKGKFEKMSIDQSEGGVISGTQKGQITWVDINGDGRQDLFFTGETCIGGNWDKSCAFYLNTGDANAPFQKIEADLPKVQKSGLDWADVNGDGMMDLVYAGEGDGDPTAFVLNKGNNTFDVQKGLVQGFRSGSSIGLYDYNNDGFVDFCGMGYGDPVLFGIFRNNGSGVKNTAPAAPSELKAIAGEGTVTFTWAAGSDAQTAAEALRYNLYVKLNNDQVISLIPANLSTGTLSLANCNNALTTRSYTLNINAADVAEWGVQTIDQGKMSSAFATSTEVTTGINTPVTESNASVIAKDGKIYLYASETAEITVYNNAGQTLAIETVQPGASMKSVFNRNIYIVKVRIGQSCQTTKVTIE